MNFTLTYTVHFYLDFRKDGVFDSHLREELQKLQTSETHYTIPNRINDVCITSIEYLHTEETFRHLRKGPGNT
jgi:hypothetical protein